MQIAMTLLTVTVVVVEVVGNVYVYCDRVAACHQCRPAVVKADDAALARRFRLWEANVTAPHRYAGGYGNAALLGVVNGTVEVVDYSVVLHYIALVGKHLVVGLGWPDEVFTLPTLPMQQVAADSKSIESVIFP